MIDSPIKHYFINLDRSPERRGFVERQLVNMGLAGERITGIDGAKLPEKVEGIDPDLYRRCHGRTIRSGEIGCYLSHLKALRAFLDSGDHFAVILEDDAVLLPSYKEVLAALTGEKMASRWDMVKLQCRRKQKPWRMYQLTSETFLGVSAMRSTGATAYLVNRNAAKRMLIGLLPMQVPWDHAFDRAVHLWIKVRAVYPYPVQFDNENYGTTIEVNRATKATGMDRVTTFFWRLRSEANRVAAAVCWWLWSKIA